MKKERPVCPHCGSNQLVADGSLEFDGAAGEWRAGSEIYNESCLCRNCGRSEFNPEWKEHKFTVLTPAHATLDLGDPPPYCTFDVDADLIEKIKSVRDAIQSLALAEASISFGAWWGPETDEYRLQAGALVISSSGAFWASDMRKHESYYIESEVIEVDDLLALWETATTGSVHVLAAHGDEAVELLAEYRTDTIEPPVDDH